MRILICGINFTPELVGIGKYTGEMAAWLAGRGHEVRVVTAPPYYPDWQVAEGYFAWWYRTGQVNGVAVWRCPVWVPKKPSGLKRIAHLLSFALSSFPIMVRQIFWRPEVIIAIEPPFFCTPATLLGARLCRAKTWLHVQDFEIDAAFELGLLSSGVMRCWVAGIEQWLMAKFDWVSTISERMRQRLGQKGVASGKCFFLPNWVDLEQIHPLSCTSPMRKALGISADQIVLLYSGNMGNKQGLELIIEAARRLAGKSQIRFVLCGDGCVREKLQRQAEGLANILWLPLQPLERLNDLLNLADVHLLPQKGGAADLVMPSKLTGMLASGRPIVATAPVGSELGKVVSKTGVVVEPENVEQFIAVIAQLIEDSEQRHRLGNQARLYAEQHLDKEKILARFEEELKKTGLRAEG
ncbi:MAG: glycosyltransferase WbuB [Thermodesulfobacteriota bacterium]